ncbi:hypothetical protein Cs7R123_46760 [Catellatospora sp. TT07R-123]|nr:hypothetical protein Cs7R123_46760 [Catellatospora sp. TT07R-123]
MSDPGGGGAACADVDAAASSATASIVSVLPIGWRETGPISASSTVATGPHPPVPPGWAVVERLSPILLMICPWYAAA